MKLDNKTNSSSQPNNKQRLIAKMVSLIMIGGSIATIGAGMYGCYKAAENNNDYSNDPRYIASVIGMAAACPTLKLGFCIYPYDDKQSKHEDDNSLSK